MFLRFIISISIFAFLIYVSVGGGGRGGGGTRVEYREVVKYVEVNVEEKKFKEIQPSVCKLLEWSRLEKCMLIGDKRSGKTSMLKYVFEKDTHPKLTVTDGTVELEIVDEFLDTIGSEVSLRSLTKLLLLSMMKFKIFPKCYAVAKPDHSLYFAGLNELIYTHLIDVNVCPVDFKAFYERVLFDKAIWNRLYRWWKAERPEKDMHVIDIITDSYKNSGIIDKDDYKLYINRFVADHLFNHPAVNMLIEKADLKCEKTELFLKLRKYCTYSYSQYHEYLLNGDPVALLFGHMLKSFSPKYVNMTSMTVDEGLEKSFVNSNDEL